MLFVASLIVAPVLVWAQNYSEEEFKVYQDVQAEKNEAKKIDMIVAFIKEKPKNDLRQYMVAEYQKVIVQSKNEKKWGEIITFGERFLGAVPGDDFTENALAAAYSETGNYAKFAIYAEKAYASKPNPDLAMEISRAYQKAGNDAKALQWKEKVLASNPNDVTALIDTMKKHMAAQNTAQAVKYAQQCLKALPTAQKPAGMDAQNWKSTTDNAYAIAYGVIGENAFKQNRYAEAIKNLESAVKYYKRYDGAYYALGMCYWQGRKLNAAMLNFAKAYVIKGSASTSAKAQLDKIFKSSNVPAATQQRLMDQAQQDLK